MIFLLKSSLCLGALYGFYVVFLRKETFFQRNRYFLLMSPVVALLLPCLPWIWEKSNPERTASTIILKNIEINWLAVEKSIHFQRTFISTDFLSNLYGLGVLLLFLVLVYRLGKLILQIRQSPVKQCRGYKLIHTQGKYPTFSFFGYLFWDDSLSLDEEKADKILMHELKHIWDGHSYDLLVVEVFKIMYWFNPVIYFIQRDLKLQHEYIADAYVLHETDPKTYSRLIVETCFQKLNLSLAHSFFKKSEIKQRIAAIHQLKTPAIHSLKLLMLIPLLALLFFSFAQREESFGNSGNYAQTDHEMNRFATAEGGLDNFYRDLEKHLIYPEEAFKSGIQGKVFIQFTVMRDGSVADLRVIKGIHPNCDKAALKAFRKVRTRWLAAKVDGKPVKQQLTLPITFSLNK